MENADTYSIEWSSRSGDTGSTQVSYDQSRRFQDFTITGLMPGTLYTFVVTAIDSTGTYTPPIPNTSSTRTRHGIV